MRPAATLVGDRKTPRMLIMSRKSGRNMLNLRLACHSLPWEAGSGV